MNIQAWVCFTDNKTIEIVNTWYNGLYLFIDNVLVVKNDSLYAISLKKPLISVKYLFGNTEKTIEVFCKAIIKINVKITIDGNNIELKKIRLEDCTNIDKNILDKIKKYSKLSLQEQLFELMWLVYIPIIILFFIAILKIVPDIFGKFEKIISFLPFLFKDNTKILTLILFGLGLLIFNIIHSFIKKKIFKELYDNK